MKKILKLWSLLICIVLLTGCIKRDNLEDVTIYTTVYPIEYLVDEIYGYNSEVKSIYPDEININEYSLTAKQIKDYSNNSSVFVYNGLSNEKKIAAKMLNANSNLKIIDVTKGLEYINSVEELWVSPANYLMMAQNIKNSLKEYVTNKYIKEEIDSNYEDLKVDISNIDAELKIIAENANNKSLIVNDKMFSFLEKYGFEVIVIDDDQAIDNLIIKKATSLINNKDINYIFIKEGTEISNNLKNITDNKKVETIIFKNMTTLTENQRNNNTNYIDMMKENVEAIKNEVYN